MLATMFLTQKSTITLLRGSTFSPFIAKISKLLSLAFLLFFSTQVNAQFSASYAPFPVCKGNNTILQVTPPSSLELNGASVTNYVYYHFDANGIQDSSISLSPAIALIYEPGVYSPYVVAILSDGRRITSNLIDLKVYNLPVAKFSLLTTDTQCFKNNNVCFKNLSVQAPTFSLPITQYVWEYGDAVFDSVTTNGDICHSYSFPGTFSVTLRAIDSLGCKQDYFIPADSPVVVKEPITPKFSWMRRSGPCFVSNYLFTNATPVHIDSLYSYTWDFGDGKTYTATAPFSQTERNFYDSIGHNYVLDGEFNPALTVTDKSRARCTDSTRYNPSNSSALPKNIKIEFDVVTTRTAVDPTTRDSVCIGSGKAGEICFKQTPIQFASAGTGDFVWNFDDPPSMQLNFDISSWKPCHSFTGMGTYFVTLTINNICGPTPIVHTFYAGATLNDDIYIDKYPYVNADEFDLESRPVVSNQTIRGLDSASVVKKVISIGGYHLSGNPVGKDTLYAYAEKPNGRPIYYISNDTLLFKAPGVRKDTITLPPSTIVYFNHFDTIFYDSIAGIDTFFNVPKLVLIEDSARATYSYNGYGVRVIGPFSRIEKPAPPPVVLNPTQKNQCGPTDTVDFVNTSLYYKSRKIYRRWDFDDNFAPQCTSFCLPKVGNLATTTWNTAIEQYNGSNHYFIANGQTYGGKMNCKFSYDTLPRHFYPNWDTVFRWYTTGKDFMPWDNALYSLTPGPGQRQVTPGDTEFWNKPVFLEPTTGTWSLTQGSGPAPYGQWVRIDTIKLDYNSGQDLEPGERVRVQRLPDPFNSANPNGKYNIIQSGTVRPNTVLNYFWPGVTYDMLADTILPDSSGRMYYIYGGTLLPGSSTTTFYKYAFMRTISRCITVRLLLRDSLNNESTQGTALDSTKLDTVDCEMRSTVQLALARADARGLGKRGRECPGANPNTVFFELGQSGSYPGVQPSCGQTFILFNFDSLADRMDNTPCELDGFVTFQGGATPGGLSTPPFFSQPNYNQIPSMWTSPGGSTIAWHYGLNAPANRPPPADTVNGWITVGLVIGSGCRDTTRIPMFMSTYRANQSLWEADITAPVIPTPQVAGINAAYTYSFNRLLIKQIVPGDTIIELRYTDCNFAKCLSDTVWYHRFLRINNLTSRFFIDTATCRLYHKGDVITTHFQDSVQDEIRFSQIQWGDNTITIDTFFYAPDSLGPITDSYYIGGVRRVRYNFDIQSGDAILLDSTEWPVRAPGKAFREFYFDSTSSTWVLYSSGATILIPTITLTSNTTPAGLSIGEYRYNNNPVNLPGINGNIPVRWNGIIWQPAAIRGSIRQMPGIKPNTPGLFTPVLATSFYRIYNVLNRLADSIVIQAKCYPNKVDTVANADTMKFFPIVQTIDTALMFLPVQHRFVRTSWEAGYKAEDAQPKNMIHLISSKSGCTQVSGKLITIGWIDTLFVKNMSGENDTLFCEQEPVHFVDSLRYWRQDCQLTSLPFVPNISASPNYTGALGTLPWNSYQIDTADFWRQDFGDPRPIQNIVTYPKWKNQQNIDTIVAEKLYWDFGDGSPIDSTLRPIHRYKKFGRYTVTLISKDSVGRFDTTWGFLNISKPIAKIGFPLNGFGNPIDVINCGNAMDFIDSSGMDTATRSGAIDSIKTNYWWFGNNKLDTVNFQAKDNYFPKWQYRNNGLFVVKLVVETYLGCADTTYDTVFVKGPRPQFQLVDAGDTIGCAPFRVKIWNLADSTGKQIGLDGKPITDTVCKTTYFDFGDKISPLIPVFGRRDTVEFLYDNPGVYEIYGYGSDAEFGGPNSCNLVVYPDTAIQPKIRITVLSYKTDVTLDKSVICKDNPVQILNNSDPVFKSYKYIFDDTLGVRLDSLYSASPLPATETRVFTDTGYYRLLTTPVNLDQTILVSENARKNCRITDTLYLKVVTPSPSFTLDTIATPIFTMTNTSDPNTNTNYEWLVRRLPSYDIVFGPVAKDSANPNYTFDLGSDTGTFEVCLTSFAKGIATSEACNDSVCDKVKIAFDKFIDIPNVFSPDGNGQNDNFVIRIKSEQQYKLDIYNRWGAKVFESGQANYTWNGKTFNEGGECPAGVYYFIFEYNLRGEPVKTITGTVTLIR
jgi:gliding motility-associated-like protein